MKNYHLKLKIIIGVLIGTLILGFLFWMLPNLIPKTKNEKLDRFAQCLAEKGITMYGAEWCPHCQNQKNLFGNSFRFILYVECPKEPQRCIAQGIQVYPTFVFKDGRKLEGEQSLENLAKESGCTL